MINLILGLYSDSDGDGEIESDALHGDNLVDHAFIQNAALSPEEIKRYQGGKKGLIGFFIGEVMKAKKGKVDPKQLNQLLREKLENWDN